MAVQQVRVKINEVWHTLTFNSLTGKYEKTVTAPVIGNVAASPNPVNAGESVLISVAVTDA